MGIYNCRQPDHLIPGRWDDTRLPNEKKLDITEVLAFSLDEASTKLREGPPKDSEADMGLKIWAGVVPLRTVSGQFIPDSKNAEELHPPKYLELCSHYEERNRDV